MQDKTTLLLIDDDRELAGLLVEVFARNGLAMRHSASRADAMQQLATPPDLVLLDLMLPDCSGIDLFRQLRDRAPRLPVIMLTAKGDPVDRVVGLELGADDYVAKPFDPRELVARIRAVLRRSASPESTSAQPLQQRLGPALLDMASRTLTVEGAEVALSTLEFKLLVELARRPGTPLSRDELTSAVQTSNYRPLERAVDVQIARLRRKLRAIDASAPWILTARGEGYVWAPPAHNGK